MQTTKLTSKSILPLTCTRAGTCCFGKAVLLNPWELLNLSREKKIPVKAFREKYTDFGGIQLRFNGAQDKKGQQACSQYKDTVGCSVHLGRPLACRLYPLGRQIQFDTAAYIYEGAQFPCLTDCPDVVTLPKLSVGEYLKGQQADLYEQAQDAYLLVMQNIADVAFELLLESGLSDSGKTKILEAWKAMGIEHPALMPEILGNEWIDILTIPAITVDIENPLVFAQQHSNLLLLKAQEEFSNLETLEDIHKASVLLVGLALHLSRGLGADTKGISEHWIETAKSYGA